jgi:hypothetical protein
MVERLPKVCIQHMALWLTVRETMRFRRTCLTFYAISFSLHAPVHVKVLKPGFLTRLGWQRTHVEHLRIDLSYPCSEDELRSLDELRTLRGLTSLFIDVSRTKLRCEDEAARMKQLFRPMDLNLSLTSFTFRTTHSDDGLEIFEACMAMNRDTLQHVHFENDWTQITALSPDTLNIVQTLVSFSTFSQVKQLSYVSDKKSNDSLCPQWTYACVGVADVELPYCVLLPHQVPDTLRGATLFASEKSTWVCPPKIEFLHVLLMQDPCLLLPRHLPLHLPNLACLVLCLMGGESFQINDRDLFAAWVAQVSFPALRTISVTNLAYDSEFVDVMHLVQHLPHIKDVYIAFSSPQVAAQMRNTCSMARALLPATTQLHLSHCDIDLEAAFLRDNHIPQLSPNSCIKAEFVEDGRLVHLRPSSAYDRVKA